MSEKVDSIIDDDVTEVILELRAGEGGDDSKLFVDDLFAAYLKYSGSLGFKHELLHSDFGHMVAKITGNGVGNAFKNEPGKHCVQRVPPTESKGRKQTSIVVVGVLPIKDDTGFEPLKNEDLETICQNGSGPGGQHQNKTASAVRMKHKPTGLCVFINGRDQFSNKRDALKILTAKVNELRLAEIDADYAAIRKAQLGDGGRSNKVRTYNFMEGRVVDHRLGTKTGNVKGVMKGEFQILFK
jgi:peptide chain release factor 1